MRFRRTDKNYLLYFFLLSLFLMPSWESCNLGKGQGTDQSLALASLNLEPDFDSLRDLRVSKKAILDAPETKLVQLQLDRFFTKTLGPNFNGAILVAHKGALIYMRHKGFSNLSEKTPVTESTPFQLASTSKPFTAMAILVLKREGKLKLTDSVSKFFPGFPYKGVTVKTLLNHRSGLPEYLYFGERYWKNPGKMMTNQDVIDMMIKYHPAPNFRPDTRFSYTNTNYVLLGSIVEKVSGMPLYKYLNETFFQPLGMDHTFILEPSDTTKRNISLSYETNGREIKSGIFDGVVGDKNGYSTVEDLFRWSLALYPGKLFSQKELDEAFTPYSNEKSGIKNYGLGWHLNCYPDGEKVVYHNGWWHGNTSAFYRFIDNESTLIILSNRFNKQVYNIGAIEEALKKAYGEKEIEGLAKD